MSDISLDFTELFLGAGIALAVALLGTPLLWRMAVPLARRRRALLANLACLGLAGLIALPFSLQPTLEETAIFALLFSATMQGILLLTLLLIVPKRPGA
jgi:hypothetical protein